MAQDDDRIDVPSWEDGVDRLLSRLPGAVGGGALTINDARTVQYLASFWQSATGGRPELAELLAPNVEWPEQDHPARARLRELRDGEWTGSAAPADPIPVQPGVTYEAVALAREAAPDFYFGAKLTDYRPPFRPIVRQDPGTADASKLPGGGFGPDSIRPMGPLTTQRTADELSRLPGSLRELWGISDADIAEAERAEMEAFRAGAPDVYAPNGSLATLGPASVRSGVADDGTVIGGEFKTAGMLMRALVAEHQRCSVPWPEPPADGVYQFRLSDCWRPPVHLGFAGPKVCHTTSGGIRVHVKPGCRCPRGR